MPYSSTIVTVFISSPGDVATERQLIIREMQAWNQRNSKARGVFLQPLTWEDAVAPDIEDYSQDVVNKQIGDDYDVLIGVMWGRFGTPTKVGDSGTQEEVERAIERRLSGNKVTVSFIFKTSPLLVDEINPEQITKVRQFKQYLKEKGAFFGSFLDDVGLHRELLKIFDRIAGNFSGIKSEGGGVSKDSNQFPDRNLTTEVEEKSDIGFFEAQDELADVTKQFTELMSEWTSDMSNLTSSMNTSTDKMNQLATIGQPDQAQVRSIVNEVTEYLSSYANKREKSSEMIVGALESVSLAIETLFNIANDFNTPEENRLEAVSSLRYLVGQIESTQSQLNIFSQSLISLPRMSTGFNKARNKAVKAQSEFLDALANQKSRYDDIIESLAN